VNDETTTEVIPHPDCLGISGLMTGRLPELVDFLGRAHLHFTAIDAHHLSLELDVIVRRFALCLGLLLSHDQEGAPNLFGHHAGIFLTDSEHLTGWRPGAINHFLAGMVAEQLDVETSLRVPHTLVNVDSIPSRCD